VPDLPVAAIGGKIGAKPEIGLNWESLMIAPRISLLALGGLLAVLAGVVKAGTAAPPPPTAFCAAPARTSAAPAPSGTLPAQTASQPKRALTLSSKDFLASLGCAPHAAKSRKARSNVRNN